MAYTEKVLGEGRPSEETKWKGHEGRNWRNCSSDGKFCSLGGGMERERQQKGREIEREYNKGGKMREKGRLKEKGRNREETQRNTGREDIMIQRENWEREMGPTKRRG